MDGVATRTEATQTMPSAVAEPEAVAPDPTIVDPAEHNVVFTSLVTGDQDIVGLVAYSIYKQNKYDWLQAYSRLQGRMPNAEEALAYLLGESTPRRLATYRHLAEAVLDGRGPDVPGPSSAALPKRDGIGRPAAAATLPTRPIKPAAPRVQMSSTIIVGLVAVLVALVLVFWMLHSGAPLPPATPGK